MRRKVSIPSRGRGKGDPILPSSYDELDGSFQSPLGEVVKETQVFDVLSTCLAKVSIPSRGSGKGDNTSDD